MEKLKNFWNKVKEGCFKAWDKFTDGLAEVLTWCVLNWPVAVVIFSSITGLLKQTLKWHRIKAEEERRNRRFYDHRTERWCTARRNLTRHEEDIIDRIYRNDRSATYRSILDEMDLLK